MKKITGIVDYGAGNLFSVIRGLRGASVYAEVVSTPEQIKGIDYLVVPGVGAFGDGIKNMKQNGIDCAIKDFYKTGKPILGICLGTQLFLTFGNEFGRHEGLNLIEGEVNRIPEEEDDVIPIPHVGWSNLIQAQSYENTILWTVDSDDYYYFTHSYVCYTDDSKHILSKFKYGKNELTAVIKKDNVIGCQFHPELSSYSGIQLLRNFHKL